MRNIALAIFDFITFKISRVLEPLLDEIEYRLAKYRLEHDITTADQGVAHTAPRPSLERS